MVQQLQTRPRVAVRVLCLIHRLALSNIASFSQEKPKPGDPTVQYYIVPDSPFNIRIWNGAMDQYGNFCLDLYDVQNSVAVNIPSDCSLIHVPHPGVYTYGERGAKLVSWEESWGIKGQDVLPGFERFAVPEGARLMLVRPNHDPFYFQIPTRPGAVGHTIQYAQPVHP